MTSQPTSSGFDDELQREDDGYRAKNISLEEALNADKDDESLAKWKQSLLGNATAGQKAVHMTSFSLIFEDGSPEIFVPLNDPDALNELQRNPIILKEGVRFRYKTTFNVQGDILSGLAFLAHVYRMKIRVMKQEYVLGSYGPRDEDHEVVFPSGFDEYLETPSGLTGRGSYITRCSFTDDDKVKYFDFAFNFKVCKGWTD
ncbi:hypothetical protein GEMRC1_000780 [Eukaryota sp. GEM-RC1]